jgi:hypothetical protein
VIEIPERFPLPEDAFERQRSLSAHTSQDSSSRRVARSGE